MPCYTPPPPWEEREQENAEAAVRILCELTKNAMSAGIPIPEKVLLWFISHREIDKQIASYGYGKSESVEQIQASIDAALKLINNPGETK